MLVRVESGRGKLEESQQAGLLNFQNHVNAIPVVAVSSEVDIVLAF